MNENPASISIVQLLWARNSNISRKPSKADTFRVMVPFTKKCNVLLEHELNVPKVLLTTSCTHALDMSAILLDIRPGDEVIIPDFTFCLDRECIRPAWC